MQLVVHSTCGATWQGPGEALQAVSELCGLPLKELEGLVLGSKVILGSPVVPFFPVFVGPWFPCKVSNPRKVASVI